MNHQFSLPRSKGSNSKVSTVAQNLGFAFDTSSYRTVHPCLRTRKSNFHNFQATLYHGNQQSKYPSISAEPDLVMSNISGDRCLELDRSGSCEYEAFATCIATRVCMKDYAAAIVCMH